LKFKHLYHIIFSLGFLVGFTFLNAQNYHVEQLTVRDGLPNSGILAIYKDSRGLLWIGTQASLCTYDGKDFLVVKTQDGTMLSRIASITEDSQGNMWFGHIISASLYAAMTDRKE